jgi:hypothetical protein
LRELACMGGTAQAASWQLAAAADCACCSRLGALACTPAEACVPMAWHPPPPPPTQ